MKRSSLIPIGAAPLLVAALAGCGSAGSAYGNNATAASTPPTAAAAAKGRALAVHSTSLGKILVDSKGRTLYAFGHDLKNKSRCSGACAMNWPPALAPKKPKVGAGVSAAKLRVIKRSDGGRQLSYAGHPLYRFSLDSAPGDMKGQGLNAFGGVWHVVSPAGKVVTHAPQSQGSSGGGGYSPGGY
jgi:predicted lipoprotein with Yx(FWY)xxD motif